jgi:hypothetical protein
MKYLCPVCGFDNMPFPPEDHNICPCCGTEFGYHDLRMSHQELRERWAAGGASWFSAAMPQPLGWNWYIQLFNAGFVAVEVRGMEVFLDRLPIQPLSLSSGHPFYRLAAT